MSGFLWGFGQLVNDPSPHLLDALRRHLQRAQAGIAVTEPSTSQNSPPVPTEPNEPTSCKIKVSQKLFESKLVQAGNGLITKQHQISIQCSSPGIKMASKTTSMQQMRCVDQHTITDSVRKKNAHTDCIARNVCRRHRQVFTILKQWPVFETSMKQSKPSSATEILKSKILGMVQFLTPTKIENLPHGFRNDPNTIIRLYRSASLEDINVEQVLTIRRPGSKRNRESKRLKFDNNSGAESEGVI